MSLSKEITAVLQYFEENKDLENLKGQQRFGINSKNGYGIKIPVLRQLGKELGKDHRFALMLWDTAVHDARLLACFVDEYQRIDQNQMDKWVQDFNSWDICDQCCSNLFDKTSYTIDKVFEWSVREEEFVKRAAYVMIACLAVHNKKLEDEIFVSFFPLIQKGASDHRNFVKKAVNWALRQMGKRNMALHSKAIDLAWEIEKYDSKAAQWIARDALQELNRESIINRVIKKGD